MLNSFSFIPLPIPKKEAINSDAEGQQKFWRRDGIWAVGF